MPAMVQRDSTVVDPNQVMTGPANDGDIMVYHIPEGIPNEAPPPYPESSPPGTNGTSL